MKEKLEIRDWNVLMESMVKLAEDVEITSAKKYVEPYNYKGIDVTTCHILATTPGIKESYSAKWVANFEGKYTPIEMFIKSCIHLGIQQGLAMAEDQYAPLIKMHEILGNSMKKLNELRDGDSLQNKD